MAESQFASIVRSLGTSTSRRAVMGSLTGLLGLRLSAYGKSRQRKNRKVRSAAKAKTAKPQAAGGSGPGQGRLQTLAVKWWSWLIDEDLVPNSANGAVDCAAGQQGQTWFLAGANFPEGGQDPIHYERTCTVPAGTQLFFPVINGFAFGPPGQAACGAPVHTPKQLEEHRQCLADFIDTVNPQADLTATVDGVAVPMVRATSALFPIHLGEPNPFSQFDVPAGTYLNAADGYWVLLGSLSPGEHVIHFTAEALIEGTLTPVIDVEYTITVA